MKKLLVLVLLVALMTVSFVGCAAKEEAAPVVEEPAEEVVVEEVLLASEEKKDEEEKVSPWENMTEEDIIERIIPMLETMPEVLSYIPEFKATRDEDGKITELTYVIDGIPTLIEEINKETLVTIHNRVSMERTRIQTERIQRQLSSTRAATQNIPKQPQIYTPPTIPRPPALPPTPPKTHTPPPQPVTPPRR